MFAPRPPMTASSDRSPITATPRLQWALKFVGIAVALLVPFSAQAELGYLEYSAGVAVMPNQNLVGDDASGAGLSGSIRADAGYAVGVAVGTEVLEKYGAVLRGEIAADFRSNEVNSLNVSGEASSASGDLRLFTAMINAYVDYDLRLPVVPFVGVGVGYGLVSIDARNADSFTSINDEASVFAWNAMVGGTLAFTTTIDFTMTYRYLMTTDPKLEGRLSTVGSRRFESEYDNHEVVVGMRVNF